MSDGVIHLHVASEVSPLRGKPATARFLSQFNDQPHLKYSSLQPQLSIALPFINEASSAAGRDRYREQQLVKMQRTTDCGRPAPGDTSAMQPFQPRLREHHRRWGTGMVRIRGTGNVLQDYVLHS